MFISYLKHPVANSDTLLSHSNIFGMDKNSTASLPAIFFLTIKFISNFDISNFL